MHRLVLKSRPDYSAPGMCDIQTGLLLHGPALEDIAEAAINAEWDLPCSHEGLVVGLG